MNITLAIPFEPVYEAEITSYLYQQIYDSYIIPDASDISVKTKSGTFGVEYLDNKGVTQKITSFQQFISATRNNEIKQLVFNLQNINMTVQDKIDNFSYDINDTNFELYI